MLIDAAGVEHRPAEGEIRVVSLVPSITELLVDLGLAGSLVGRTGFCIHPRDVVRGIPKVGGTKDVKIDRIRELAPTHVVVNIDENRLETVEEIASFTPSVIVTHPLAPIDNLELYRLLGAIFGREAEAAELCARFEEALAALGPPGDPVDVLYLIWRDPWMTVSRDTYISRTLALDRLADRAGRERRPLPARRSRRAGRHRRAGPALERALQVSRAAHSRARVARPGAEVMLIDGEMTSWYGSRAISALGYLGGLARRSDK